MRAAVMALVAPFAFGAAVPRQALATHELTFVATLTGAAEVPSNKSTARGTAVAVIDGDNRVTYAVNSTGFETQYRVAHVHIGPADAAGPILFPIECDEEGMTCSGTSPVLDDATLKAFADGNAYVNLHTERFPTGEIRGQLASLSGTAPAAAGITRFAGKVSGVGVQKGAEIKIKGRFTTFDPLDLVTSTASVLLLLTEAGGTGELVANAADAPLLSTALMQKRPDDRGKEAVFSAVATGGDPACRLKVKRVEDGLYEYQLDCKRSDGAKIPKPPTLCSAERHPKTNLRTWLVLSAGAVVGVDVTQPWRCLGRNGVVRELKAVELKGTDNPVAPGPPTPENEPPTADFRADPRDGRAPLTVQFENRSTDRDGDPLTFEWSFGDGGTSAEENPSHVYTAAGRFDVHLVVRDPKGGVDEKEQDIEVDPAP
jgi:hypothetical protein